MEASGQEKSFALYWLLIAATVMCLIFADRILYLFSLSGAVILWLAARSVGRLISIRNSDIAEICCFPLGLGILLSCVYVMGLFSLNWQIIAFVWIAFVGLAVRELPVLRTELPVSYLWASPFLLIGIWASLTPSLFYDTLTYHLGLPYRFLADGKISVYPHHLFSTFPPFEFVLNLLFTGANILPGIKFFSLILYLQIVSIILRFLKAVYDPEPLRNSEVLVWTMLLFPAPWILIHVITADLLTGLFLCSAILAVAVSVKSQDLSAMFPIAVVTACSIWTKINSLLYVALLPVLFFALYKLFPTRKTVNYFAGLLLITATLSIPLLVRNYISVGDPLYPLLSKYFKESLWTERQELALKRDSFAGQRRSLQTLITAPFNLTFKRASFGSAAEIGILYLLSAVLYPFTKKISVLNHVLIYVLACYSAWILIFQNFRQFFPIFILLNLLCYASMVWIRRKSILIIAAILFLSLFASVHGLIPIFLKYFPLISSTLSTDKYLSRHLDYFEAANRMNTIRSRILFLGETRSTFISQPAIVSTVYDSNPFWKWVRESESSEQLLEHFKNHRVEFIFCNWDEYSRAAEKTGLLPIDILPRRFMTPLLLSGRTRSDQPLITLSQREKIVLQGFLSRYVAFEWNSGSHLYFYSVRQKR